MELSLGTKRLCRHFAESHANCPVVIVPGKQSPRMAGESYYWTTPSGKTRVSHPNAYGWPTWYHASTLHVAVGHDWLASYGLLPEPSDSIVLAPSPMPALSVA